VSYQLKTPKVVPVNVPLILTVAKQMGLSVLSSKTVPLITWLKAVTDRWMNRTNKVNLFIVGFLSS